ncbi:SPO22 [Candida jiufengensis]|uniref:SPO22 n=1 Tax=Candida jiufengensis TaxID=497108 RepID=UPI0022254737|nr:SPO22 [Candida jiufengensis]KAI5951682.1 SPO22 [Candida jiufengensis]
MTHLVSNIQGKTAKEIYNTLSSKQYEGNTDLLIQKKIDLILPIAENICGTIDSDPLLIQLPTDLQESLDSIATKIWNISGSITLDIETSQEIQLFAITILIVYEKLNPNITRCFTIINCLIKLFATSVQNTNNSINIVAKKSQNHLENILNKLLVENGFNDSQKLLLDEYYNKFLLLSLNYTVLLKDFNLSKIYESKINKNLNVSNLPLDFVLDSTRILYNCGLDQFNERKYDITKFLVTTAIKLIELHLNDDSSELIKRRYLNLYILLIKCYKCIGNKDSTSKAITALEQIQNQFSEVFEVYSLYFEILDEPQDLAKFDDMLMRMVMSVDIADKVHETISLLEQITLKSYKGVNNCLDYLITNVSIEHAQLESLIIAKFMVNIELAENKEPFFRIKELVSFVQLIERTIQQPLSVTTKTSIMALVWKKGISMYNSKDYEQSSGWLQLSLSRIFHMDYMDNQDRGKIVRAIQNNQLSIGDAKAVIKSNNLMDEEDQFNILSQYNLFRAYLKLNDEKKAIVCFSNITKHPINSTTILTIAACIIESTEILSNEFMKNSLLQLLNLLMSRELSTEFIDKLGSFGIVLPICFRCAILLYSTSIEKDFEINANDLIDVCEMLESCCKFALTMDKINNHLFSTNDLEWFASKAYNLSLVCQENNNHDRVIQLCHTCIGFTNLISPKIDKLRYESIFIWKVRANLIIFSMIVNQTRTVENQLNWSYVKEQGDKIIDEVTTNKIDNEDWVECKQLLYAYAFEAELMIGSIDQILQLIRKTSLLNSKMKLKLFDVYVNLINYSKKVVNKHVKQQILRSMINFTFETSESSNLSTLITWIRIYLELSNSNDNYDDNSKSTSINIVGQFYKLYKANITETNIPTFEIEWLASMSWNFGVKYIIDFNDLKIGLKWCAYGIVFSKFIHEKIYKQFDEITMSPTTTTTNLTTASKDSYVFTKDQLKDKNTSTISNYHPSLILQDKQTDLVEYQKCGCCGKYCVKNIPNWIPRAKR